MSKQLMKIIESNSVSKVDAKKISEGLAPFLDKVAEWKEAAEALVVTNEDDVEKMKEARAARLELKAIRVESNKVRKDLKQQSLNYGRAVQDAYNAIESAIKPLEEHLENQEKFAERLRQERKEQLISERMEKLSGLEEFLPMNLDFGVMTEDEFDNFIKGGILLKENKEKEEREAAEKAEEEQRQLDLHNSRKEFLLEVWGFVADEHRVDLHIHSDEEFLKIFDEAKEASVQKEKELEKAKEQERIEREKAEKAEEENRKLQEQIEAERKEMERIQAENEAKIKAEKEAEERRIEDERKAKEEAAKKLAKAGDKEKLTFYHTQIVLAEIPSVKSKVAKNIISDLEKVILDMEDFISE